ncbi:unnamed protein product [Linum trigynum]|uniref:Uncharacterized protein n=1 Tax=Linum trigynum TaxID=586398 RepID=A0AAV2D1C1_9ROSI
MAPAEEPLQNPQSLPLIAFNGAGKPRSGRRWWRSLFKTHMPQCLFRTHRPQRFITRICPAITNRITGFLRVNNSELQYNH